MPISDRRLKPKTLFIALPSKTVGSVKRALEKKGRDLVLVIKYSHFLESVPSDYRVFLPNPDISKSEDVEFEMMDDPSFYPFQRTAIIHGIIHFPLWPLLEVPARGWRFAHREKLMRRYPDLREL